MAARRYEGRYSPGSPGSPGGPEAPAGPVPPPPAPARGRDPAARQGSLRARLLYLAAIPMLVAGIGEIFQGDGLGMAVELGAFLLLVSGAILVNEGVKAEAAFAERRVAKPPAIPRKLLGALAIGLGIGLGAAFGWGLGLLQGAVFGLVAAGATLLAFGPDPMRAKGMEGVDRLDSARAAEAVARGAKLVEEMRAAARRFGDRGLEARVTRFAAAAEEMFRAVENDPRDLTRARRLLGVYLGGVRDATVRFADLWARNRDAKARAEYEALLGDLEASFARHRQELLAEESGALDVEIDVLRRRLRQDGLA